MENTIEIVKQLKTNDKIVVFSKNISEETIEELLALGISVCPDTNRNGADVYIILTPKQWQNN